MSTRETYDLMRERWCYQRDAYLGGVYWAQPSSPLLGTARLSWSTIDEDGRPIPRTSSRLSYLVPHEGESDDKFSQRCALASYINIVAPVVKAYAEGVTTNIQRELTPLAEFAEDVDRRGSTWGELVEQVATWSACYGVVATVVDAPSVDVSELSEAQRVARGIAPYVVTVHPSAWIAVECDEGRVTLFAYTSTPFRNELSSVDRTDVEVRVWRATTADHSGGWEVRRGSVLLSRGVGAQFDALPVVASGPLPAALAGEIPVTFAFYEREASSECPMGVSLIADTADAARLIYNRSSWIDEIDRKAAFPFLAIPLAGTGGQLDDATRIKVGTENALGFSSAAGAPNFVEPSGTSQRVMREQIVFAFQWAMRCAGLELAADSSAQVQSGEALRIRSRDFESRAKRFARNLQRWEVATLRLLAAMAGRPAAVDAIQITYPKRITLPDPLEDLERAMRLILAPVEIGTLARREAVKQAVDAALSLSDEQLSQVSEELDALYNEDLATSSAKLTVERLRAENERTGLEQIAANATAPASTEPSTVAAVVDAAPPDATVQDLALNGAQSESIQNAMLRAMARELPVATVREFILLANPALDPAKVDRMIAPIVAAVASTPAPTPASAPVVPEAPTSPEPPNVTDASA